MQLRQKSNSKQWERMEQQNQESQEDVRRGKELHRVLQTIRNTPIERSKGKTGPSKTIRIGENSEASKTTKDLKIELTSSNNPIDVPAKKHKRYLKPIGLRYIQMIQARHIQTNKTLEFVETIRQAEQKFTAD